MSTTVKAKVEGIIALVLLAVFLKMMVGTLKGTGILGKTSNRSESTTTSLASNPPNQQTNPSQRSEPTMASTAQSTGGQPAVARYTADTVRDPMTSLLPTRMRPEQSTGARSTVVPSVVSSPAPSPQPPALAIQGLIWGGPRPQALINGELFDIGETVQGARIVAISRDGITVDVQGSTFVLQPKKSSQPLSRTLRPGGGPLTREPQHPVPKPPMMRGER